jgi:hypothetical protein
MIPTNEDWRRVPISNQYSDTPAPVFHTKVTADDVSVDPGGGLVICALKNCGEAQ